MPIAFKEWAVTVRALAEGEQLLTLRKGGIREPEKHFKLDYERFFLYPTFDHQRADLVRETGPEGYGKEERDDAECKLGDRERGKIEIAFYSSDDLERVLDLVLASRERT